MLPGLPEPGTPQDQNVGVAVVVVVGLHHVQPTEEAQQSRLPDHLSLKRKRCDVPQALRLRFSKLHSLRFAASDVSETQ